MQNAGTWAWDGVCVHMRGGTHINRSNHGQMATELGASGPSWRSCKAYALQSVNGITLESRKLASVTQKADQDLMASKSSMLAMSAGLNGLALKSGSLIWRSAGTGCLRRGN